MNYIEQVQNKLKDIQAQAVREVRAQMIEDFRLALEAFDAEYPEALGSSEGAPEKGHEKVEAKKAPKAKTATKGRPKGQQKSRPPLAEAMAQVMGAETMGAGKIFGELKKKGWLPNSKDPRSYIQGSLSTRRDQFERVARGLYRVKAATKKAPVVKVRKKAPTETDVGLGQLGIKDDSVAVNPFSKDASVAVNPSSTSAV